MWHNHIPACSPHCSVNSAEVGLFMPLQTLWVWLQEATAALQEEQQRKAFEDEQKLAQERGPILGVRCLFTEQTLVDMLEIS